MEIKKEKMSSIADTSKEIQRIENEIVSLKEKVTKYEVELKTLRARAKVSKAQKSVIK